MATNRRLVDNSGPDFYPTPAWGTRALTRHVQFNGTILEPCCGDGAMAEVLKETGNDVVASDIIDRGYGDVADFLSVKTRYSNIITNPPFNVAESLLHHALGLADEKVCFLLRTAFVESKRRYKLFYKERRPTTILIFSERLSMYPSNMKIEGGGTTSYAWFIWNLLDASGETKMEWIAPGSKEKNDFMPEFAGAAVWQRINPQLKEAHRSDSIDPHNDAETNMQLRSGDPCARAVFLEPE